MSIYYSDDGRPAGLTKSYVDHLDSHDGQEELLTPINPFPPWTSCQASITLGDETNCDRQILDLES